MNKRLVIILINLIIITLFIAMLTMGLALAQADGKPKPEPPSPPGVASLPEFPAIIQPAAAAPEVTSNINDPVNCTLLSSPVVGFETSRGQSANDVTSFLNDLVAGGYSAGTVDIGSGSIPVCVDILIIRGLAGNVALTSAYTAADGAMLQSWIASGHGLMLLSDWDPFIQETQALFQTFGYTVMSGAGVSDGDPADFDPSGPANLWVIYQSDNFANHPVFNGVTALELLLSGWFTPATNVLVTTDANATPSNETVAAALSDGSGCAVLLADSNWIADADNGYFKEDNTVVARQIIDWLYVCFSLSLRKSASTSSVQPGEFLTYTMATTNHYTSTLSNVRITDTVPVGTSFVSASTPYTGPDGNGTVNWDLGSIGSNGSVTVTMVVQVNNGLGNGAIITNTAYVYSDGGLTDSATALVTVNAPPPTAVSGGPYTVNEGSSVLLDGSSSTDPNSSPLSYAWDLDNDGLFDDATGATVTFSAATLDDGAYPVALLVDNGALTDTDSAIVSVNNVAPQVTLSATNWNPNEGQSTSFTGSFTDPGVLDTHQFVWDFGDGSGPMAGTLNETYTYNAAGQYTVTLTITDDDGGVGQDTGLVMVGQQILPPSANAGGPYNVNEGSSIQLDSSGSADPNSLSLSHAWDLDNDGQFDDATGTAPTFSAAALDDGAYPVAVQVSNGVFTDTNTTSVTVLNVAPQPSLEATSWYILAGQTVTFTGSFTDPGILDTHQITWDHGAGGGPATGSLVESAIYPTTGLYTVTLTISDDDGGVGQTQRALQVTELVASVFLPIVSQNYCAESTIPADIILALDTSSSMNKPAETGGTRLDAAKSAADTFIDLINFPTDQAGVVSFDTDATLEHPLGVNAASLHNAIQSLTATGITRMDLALLQSRQELTGPRRQAGSTPVLIMLTDGQPNGISAAEVRAEADATKAAGITIYTIGLGADVDVALMRDIATSPNHYYQAPSTADLNAIYQQIAEEIHCN